MSRHLRVLIIGVALILGGNAVALIGVAYNRAGQPNAVLELSERELSAPYRDRSTGENSGLTLHLNWRSAGDIGPYVPGMLLRSHRASWLDKDKLAALGFDVSADPHQPAARRRYQKTLPRTAYIALQFNGPAYRAVVQSVREQLDDANAKLAADPGNKALQTNAKVAQRRLGDVQHKSSRLFAVDVAPDRETLRRRYPDRARYLILPGEVRLMISGDTLTGYITGLRGTNINVPLSDRTAIIREGGTRRDHYTVRLAFGKRDEPWILTARAGEGENNGDNGGAAD